MRLIPTLDDDPTLSALQLAIVADPAADDPRLQFADRLDELGGAPNAAWAAFIRAQIDLNASCPYGEPTMGDGGCECYCEAIETGWCAVCQPLRDLYEAKISVRRRASVRLADNPHPHLVWPDHKMMLKPNFHRGFHYSVYIGDLYRFARWKNAGNVGRLFAAYPITHVTVGSRSPVRSQEANRLWGTQAPPDHYGWYESPFHSSSDDLPPVVWEQLTAFRSLEASYPINHNLWRWYPTSEEAHRAMVRAVFVYGRAQAAAYEGTGPEEDDDGDDD